MHNQAPPPPDFYPESFPGWHAGMPTSSGNALPACFGHEDEPIPSENPWALFNSKLDWEIAHWAKLRGPGSTAVSDLLSIDGVCFLLQHLLVDALTANSFKKAWICHIKTLVNSADLSILDSPVADHNSSENQSLWMEKHLMFIIAMSLSVLKCCSVTRSSATCFCWSLRGNGKIERNKAIITMKWTLATGGGWHR